MMDVGGAMVFVTSVLLVCLLGAIPFFTVLNAWLVEKSMDTVLAVSMMLGILLMIGAMIVTWFSPIKWLILGLLLGLNFCVPVLLSAAGKVAEKQMTNEDIERYMRLIERDPRNAAAHAFLADAYMEVGRYRDAATEYETAIQIDPDHSQRERWQLQKAVEKVTGQPQMPDLCPNCHAEQPQGLIRCQQCGHYMKGIYFLKDMSRQAAPAGGILLVGTLLSSVCSKALPEPVPALICIVALVAACGLLWQKMKAA